MLDKTEILLKVALTTINQHKYIIKIEIIE